MQVAAETFRSGDAWLLPWDEPARDAEGGERSLEALKREDRVRAALEELKLFPDESLEVAVKAIGLEEDLPAELIESLTVRYRAIRYAPRASYNPSERRDPHGSDRAPAAVQMSVHSLQPL